MAKLQIDGTFMLLLGLGLALQSMPASAQPSPVEPTAEPRAERDGQHDFDWEIGTWKTELKRRLRPLTGSDEWVEYQGTSHVRKVWDGRANLVELGGTGDRKGGVWGKGGAVPGGIG